MKAYLTNLNPWLRGIFDIPTFSFFGIVQCTWHKGFVFLKGQERSASAMNRDQDFCLSEEPLIGYFSARAAASQNQISYREASAKWALNWLWRFFKKDSTVNLSFTFGWIYPIELCFSMLRRFISQKVVGTLFFPKRGHSE